MKGIFMKRKHLIWIALINTFTLSSAMVIILIWVNLSGDITTAFNFHAQLTDEEKRFLQSQNQLMESDREKHQEQLPLYEADLYFDPKSFTLSGTTRITAWNRGKQATNELNLELFLKAFNKGSKLPILPELKSRSYPRGAAYGNFQLLEVKVEGEKITYSETGTILKIALQKEWKPKEKIIVDLKWKAVIPEIYHRVGMKNDAFWFGNALPTLAVYDTQWRVNQYEAVGDPFVTQTSNYKVRIVTPSQYQVIATGNQTEAIHNDLKETKIEAIEVRDFAFAISANHKLKSAVSKSGKQVNLHYRYLSEGQASQALKTAVQMLDYMERRVGEYPYQKLEVFENEMFLSGMEYPGLIFIGYSKFNYTSVAHEVAHQWFYNLVGNDQIHEPWLDEGLVTYFTDEFLKGDRLDQYYANEEALLAKSNIQIEGIHGYTRWSAYWSGVYRKGSLMYYKLRKEMGEEAFSDFIRDYVKNFRNQIVTQSDFIHFAQKYTDKDLDAFFKKWLFQ